VSKNIFLGGSGSLAEKVQGQKSQVSTWVKTDLIRWIGATMIIMGVGILFASYIYVPLNVWHGAAWNPATWTWDPAHAYKNGWLGVIPLVIGVVIYMAARTMKPKTMS
jgi:hypothetical protein